MSMIGNSLLNEFVQESGHTQPAQVLDMMKQRVIQSLNSKQKNNETRDGMDIALCRLDKNNRILEFAGAYNPLYLIRNGELIEIKGDKHPIGKHLMKDNVPFTNHSIAMQEGDVCYVFSDGYPDQFGGEHFKKFNYKRFKELLLHIHTEPMHRQKEILNETLLQWQGQHRQLDDILVIGFA